MSASEKFLAELYFTAGSKSGNPVSLTGGWENRVPWL
jgi:hypothetical protein